VRGNHVYNTDKCFGDEESGVDLENSESKHGACDSDLEIISTNFIVILALI
jgi:hypothetical protein